MERIGVSADRRELQVRRRVDDDLGARVRVDHAKRLVDFDKAWMAIMHVLTQFPDLAAPAKALFIGTDGTSVSSDPGYGPAIYISPQVAGDLKAGLDRLSNDELKQRYDPEAMEREYVYCAEIFTHEPVEGWRYLAHGLDKLRRFLTDCSESESGVVKLLV